MLESLPIVKKAKELQKQNTINQPPPSPPPPKQQPQTHLGSIRTIIPEQCLMGGKVQLNFLHFIYSKMPLVENAPFLYIH